MPTWYDKLKMSDSSLERFRIGVQADVWIPIQQTDFMTSSLAKTILEGMLRKIEGDASAETTFDSSIRIVEVGLPQKID